MSYICIYGAPNLFNFAHPVLTAYWCLSYLKFEAKNGWFSKYILNNQLLEASHFSLKILSFRYLLWNLAWYTIECRYNVVEYIMILHTILQWQQQNINHTLNPQKASHISPSHVTYGISVVRICEKIDCVKTALHCIQNCWIDPWHNPNKLLP